MCDRVVLRTAGETEPTFLVFAGAGPVSKVSIELAQIRSRYLSAEHAQRVSETCT